MSIGNDFIKLSDSAVDSIREILKDNDMEDHALRFGIRGGGCSGYSYVLEFSDEPEEGDDTIEVAGLRVFVGDFKRDFLAGTLIDYETSEWEAGFKIKNPNAKRPCGCGESFDIDEQKQA
ncbi:MAG: iron-sulfur cluster assembly accessory protein [Alphaproteobacteria bacterium]|nr:iron-sulfur cluster assembly accessory protein [Alphaproteobacteria bacterium]